MGVFSINESHFNIGSLPEVGMNEEYTSGTDMCVALFEAKENEYAVLEAGIKQDVVAAMCEDYDERLAINEATASGVMGKIKEILTKLLEKLKSIFHSFMAKINSFFMDSDKFFKRYSTDIAKKDFKDFEIKARKFYPDRVNEIIDTKNNLIPSNNGSITTSSSFSVGNNAFGFAAASQQQRDQMMDSDKLGEIAKKAVITAAALKAMSIDDDLGNVAEEIEEYIFEDSETHDELRSTDILTSDWIGGLLNKKKFISDIDKCNKDNEKKIEKAISDINKHITNIGKTLGKDGEAVKARNIKLHLNTDPSKKAEYSNAEMKKGGAQYTSGSTDTEKSNAIAGVAYQQALVSKEQELLIKANNARLSCAKKGMAQARKIFAAAVAYNPKKENYDYYMAVGESAEFEAIMAME